MAYTEGTDTRSNIWGMQLDPTGEFYYLPDPEPGLLDQLGGGGGGGMSFRMGGGGPNQLDRTLAWAETQPLPKQEFKLATDQYAARYSDQLNAMALEELKQKFPEGPKSGKTWEEEFARQEEARKLGLPWGVEEHLQKKLPLPVSLKDKLMATAKPSYSTKDDYGIGGKTYAPTVQSAASSIWSGNPHLPKPPKVTVSKPKPPAATGGWKPSYGTGGVWRL
jgi:hypothetical protein